MDPTLTWTLGMVSIWTALLFPILVAAAALAVPASGRCRGGEIAAGLAVLAGGIGLVVAVMTGGPVTTAGGLLRADALSAYLLAVVGVVAVTATWGGLQPAARSAPPARQRLQRRYLVLVCLFLSAMVLAVLADNLGVCWVAIEGTTIATAFLVGHAGGRRSLEAAWKYVVLGSVGVGIAFLGLVLLFAATRAAGTPTLSWLALVSAPPAVDPVVTRTALALAALGFATKAGLAPMHSWLPDAHSQAPAPVSGLMSGVLLAVAFGVILRLQALDTALLHGRTVRDLLLVTGLLSLLVAAALVIGQQDYKRLLAYSSIEHMGLLALGAAIGGPLALTAMLLHLLGHGLVKATTFVVAGRILQAETSSRISDIRALLSRRPRLAVPFLAGTLALLGMPPSGLFFTETALVLAGLQQGLAWVVLPAAGLLLVTTAGIARHVQTMTLGRPANPGPPTTTTGPGTRPGTEAGTEAGTVPAVAQAVAPDIGPAVAPDGPLTPVILALGLSVVIAFAVGPFARLLSGAVAVLAGRA